jgi:hypothetical protein
MRSRRLRSGRTKGLVCHYCYHTTTTPLGRLYPNNVYQWNLCFELDLSIVLGTVLLNVEPTQLSR